MEKACAGPRWKRFNLFHLFDEVLKPDISAGSIGIPGIRMKTLPADGRISGRHVDDKWERD